VAADARDSAGRVGRAQYNALPGASRLGAGDPRFASVTPVR